MILLGLCGKKYVGKDTLADYLVSRHGFIKKSFAGPLKDMCQHLFLFSDAQCHNPRLKDVVDPRWNLSPRMALQMVGTDWIRNQWDKDFWVKRMHFDLSACQNHDRIVLSDVRFENEKDLVVGMGGHVWGISRSRVHTVDSHESETNLDGFFASLPILENNGSVVEFYEKIDMYLNDLLSSA